MDWLSIIITLAGSTGLSTAIIAINNRRKTKADIQSSYTDRLEKRIEILEKRLDSFESRDRIFMEAMSTAYRCGQKECPVLQHLTQHPLPDKE